jgi:hypothetical protein
MVRLKYLSDNENINKNYQNEFNEVVNNLKIYFNK